MPSFSMSDMQQNDERSQSPEAPPYSPITPTLEATQLPPLPEDVPPAFMEKPPDPEPLDMATNPDAIALRAALSALQVQKMRATKDMQLLELQKAAALEQPERFAKGLAEGSITTGDQKSALAAVLPDDVDDASGDEGDEDGDTNMDDAQEDDIPTWKEGKPFGNIPEAQNIVRMPHINWAKYNVVGEPLDALHEQQRSRPDSGHPRASGSGKAPVHLIAAPYSPWKDKIPASSNKKKNDTKKG